VTRKGTCVTVEKRGDLNLTRGKVNKVVAFCCCRINSYVSENPEKPPICKIATAKVIVDSEHLFHIATKPDQDRLKVDGHSTVGLLPLPAPAYQTLPPCPQSGHGGFLFFAGKPRIEVIIEGAVIEYTV